MRRGVFLALLVLLAGGAAPALAQPARGSGSAQPLDSIIEGIRNSRPGSFYDAQGPFQGPDGRSHYRIKWMTPEGRVIWLDTDAHTGRVLGTGGGGRRGFDRGGEERGPQAAPDRGEERVRRHDDGERNRFERGGEDRGFGPARGWPDGNGRGERGRGRYDRGDFGGRTLPGGGRGHGGRHGGPNER